MYKIGYHPMFGHVIFSPSFEVERGYTFIVEFKTIEECFDYIEHNQLT